jgi:alkanesulfonate monooxygenase SsuD/methylene tetrahydromethanopterin reductase-like flavin-dependent oxidoreductase (luciferase family)
MHLGLMLECEYRPDTGDAQAFSEAFSLADHAERTGWDAVWLAERHFSSPERIARGTGGGVPSFASAPLILANALAKTTQRVRIGIAVSVLPLSHPVRLAEEVATLDHVSGGRLDFGIGRSGFATSYAGYGIDYGESRGRFNECLDILRLAWTQESFSYEGEYFNYSDVSVVPKPLQQPYPPLRVAATTNDTFPVVGEMGVPIFIGLRGTDLDDNKRHLALYREAWRDAGHPGDGDVYLRIPVYVGDTADAAYNDPMASTMQSYQRLAESYANSAEVSGARTSEERAARGVSLANTGYDALLENRLAYGTPDVVTRRLSDLRDDLGLTGFVVEPNVGGGIARDKVFRSVQLFAEQVAPALR